MRRIGTLLGLVLVCGTGIFFLRRSGYSTNAVPPGTASRTTPIAAGADPTAAQKKDGLAARLEELRQRLAKGADASAKDCLDQMAEEFAAGPREEAAAAILAMLNRGVDASTGLIFKVGPNGNLTTSPTLRVWLLDQLGRWDAVAAADYAEKIYARHDSADEWALALRNEWRGGAPADRIEAVRGRTLELLNDPSWSERPTVGFLEALDVAVATMAWEAVPRFEQWLAPTQSNVLRTGAWIALDRLTMEVPADFLPALAQHRDWLASQPNLRAGLMARANVGAAGERQAVEAYLERDDVSFAEGKRFFELLPNATATVSHNLVTTARVLTPARAAQLDQAALAGVQAWREQSKFSRWATEMAAAESRLAESVASATRGGYLQP